MRCQVDCGPWKLQRIVSCVQLLDDVPCQNCPTWLHFRLHGRRPAYNHQPSLRFWTRTSLCKVFAVFRGQLSELPRALTGDLSSEGPVRLLPARDNGVGPLRQVEAGSEPWLCGAGGRWRRAWLPAALR